MGFNRLTSIKELHDLGAISLRTFNSLHFAGMNTLGEILDTFEKPMDLMNLRNFGRKAYTEMEPILNQVIYSPVISSANNSEISSEVLDDFFVKIITEAYTEVTKGETEVVSYLTAAYPHPSDMHYLVMDEIEKMLEVVEDYSREENLEIRHSYKLFMDLVMKGMENAQEAERDVYVEYKRKIMDFAMKMEDFSYEQKTKFYISPIASDYLEKSYQSIVESRLSTRAKNFVAKYLPHFTDLIKYADKPLSNYSNICPGQSMRKTLTELFQFNQKFKREFDRVSVLTDDEIQTDLLKHEYPYLMSKQRQFVFDFIKVNNHAPLFFLLLQYLRLSENRSNKFYCLFHGIFDGVPRTLSEIADTMNLSRERVRQIVSRKIEVQESELASNEGWKYYQDLFQLPFIYEKSDEFLKLKEAERLSVDFRVFASLIKLVADFKALDVEGHIILVNKNNKDLNFPDFLDTIYSIIDAKYSIDTYIPIDNVLFTVPKKLKPAIKDVLTYLATNIFKVQITDDEQLFLPQNFIDITEELYDILAKKGEPMHIENIFKEFKELYPDHKFTDPLQIKSYLFRHKHIKAVGKTSCYALDSWEGIYFGSIRDLLVDLLSASEEPLHIDTLYDGVTEYYPNTTKASLAATMEDENLQRFVEFEGGYFGLTSKTYSSEYVVAPSVQRYRFEERFQMFKDFVNIYHRFPSYNGSDNEASLMRWVYNVTSDIISVTEEQKAMLNDTLKHYDEQGIPRSATESEFLIKCEDMKDFIREKHTLPTNREAPELYAWFRRSRDNYDSFTDKRRQYMTDLLNYILSFGFSI